MKKLFFFSIICLFCQISFGQSAVSKEARTEAMNDPKFIEFKKNHDAITAKQGGIAFISSYYGYEETLKSYFVGNMIPVETPRSNGIVSKTEYVKILNEWISKNKNLLKPEHKNSLISE
ncbi:MAG TPA: hypothetical protein VN026_11610 [Bacteroidia bacterium]|jgi:hypothetical protein|nr:hypothetical protein [Bacteroidia bacterium]